MAFTTIQGSGGAPDSFLGTAGVDVIALQNQADASFLSARQSDDVVTFTSFTQLVSNYTLYGGQGDDTLEATGNTNLANSFIAQNEGDDGIFLNAVTSSTVQGNEGADFLGIDGLITSAVINGNQGNDTLNVTSGATAGLIYGGVGFDQIAIAGALNGGTRVQANEDDDIITIAVGTSLQDSTVNGNQGNDVIVVNGPLTAFSNSTIYGGSGNDNINTLNADRAVRISTDDGNDTVNLGDGNNQVFNSAGNDELNGGDGNDTFTSTAGNATIDTGDGNNRVTAGAGNIDVTGGAEDDTIVTGTGTDTIDAGDGSDTVDAGGGNDIVNGEDGADELNGGTGNDTITGGDGIDELTGGVGADSFVWTTQVVAANANDITDFNVLQNDLLTFSVATFDSYVAGQDGAIDTAASYTAGEVIVDTEAHIRAANLGGARRIVALATDTGNIWVSNTSGDFTAAAGADIGTITAAQAAAFTGGNLSFIA